MSLDDLATIVVSTTGAGVTRAGYGVPMIVSHTAQWAERKRVYASLGAVGVDFAVNSPEYMAAEAIFSQSPKVRQIVIGRAALAPLQNYTVGVRNPAINTPYSMRMGIATGVVFPSQDATYQSAGATGWVASNTWSRGDLVMGGSGPSGPQLYSCLGPSGAGYAAQFTGIGNAIMPSGAAGAIRDGGVYWMPVGSGSTGGITADAIIQGLKSKLEALGAPTAIGTGAQQAVAAIAGGLGSRTLTLTANAAGKFFAAQVYDRQMLTVAQDHADPGIATDLAAIKLQSNAWYGLVTLYNSEPLIKAAAAYVEANTKLYPAASVDTKIATDPEGSSATDVAHDMRALSYARSWVFFHPSPDEFADAASLGKWFPVSPGGENWRMKTLAGVTVEPYGDDETANFLAKNVAYFYDVGGRFVVGGKGKSAGGSYVDTVRFLDWYTSELQAKLANLAIDSDKIPFTNAGIDSIEGKVRQQNKAGIDAGGIAPDPEPIVTSPDVLDISSEDKADRELSGVETQFTLAGAIDHITVNVTATQ